jgi:hypothetical protein
MNSPDQDPPGPANGARPRPGFWLHIGVFLTVLFANLNAESRTPPHNDSKFIYSVAESIVYRKAIDIPVAGGKLYAQHPLLPSAIHVPGVYLRKLIAKDDPAVDKLVKPLTSHFGNQVATALGCVVFFRLLLFLGLSLGTATLGTLALAAATFLPVYARSAWSEALQATCFIGFFSALLRLAAAPGRKTGLWFGVWCGLLVSAKYALVLALPGAAVFLGWGAYRAGRVRDLLRALAWPAIPGVVFLALILWYNWARTGTSLSSGYPSLAGLLDTVLRENLFVGLWSYFFSFGKSVFLYNPPLVLSVLALPLVSRRNGALLWALLLTAGPIVCLYSKFVFWSGDWCWGPRYLLFAVPPMLIPGLYLVDELVHAKRRLALGACAAVLALGIGVQVVGASQYWDHFIRYSKLTQAQWLGVPNRSGALTPDRGGACDPCFEDFYARNFTPAFQPIEGQWWLLKHHILGHSWPVAAQDLPLRRYTNLELQTARDWYLNPPWDWWKRDFVGRYQPAGAYLWRFFITGLVVGILLWAYGLRRAAQPAAGPAELATGPCAGTGRSGWPRPWPRLRAFLAPRFGRLRDRLRGRGR